MHYAFYIVMSECFLQKPRKLQTKKEVLNMIMSFAEKSPSVEKASFIAENASIIGNVTLEENANIWFGAVLRADIAEIRVGKNTNIQDNAVIHVSIGKPAIIGDNVTIGHSAIVHGATVGNNVLIGMGSIILDGAVIGDNCVIGAGAVVTSNTVVPDNTMMLGTPAKPVKEITPDKAEGIKMSAEGYVKLSKSFNKI
jgi:carbonic anhydrase/acetyltransferase-like protein (isoleucine patch superfamily)